MVLAVKLKRYIPYSGMFCVIISEFCYRYEPRAVLLFVINKDFKVSFYCAVLPLNLTVSLRIEGCKEPLFDA